MLIRKLFRTMGLYRAQFLSMIIMIALGVGVFLGMNMEWYSIDKNTAYLFDTTGFADYRIVSENGFSSEDADKIAVLDGVDAVSRYLSIQVDVKEKQDESVALTVTENAEVSGFLLMEGNAYEKDSKDGKYLINVRDESQLMPDYTNFGFAYISPAMYENAVGFAYYPQINVISSLSKEIFTEKADDALQSISLILTKDETASYADTLKIPYTFSSLYTAVEKQDIAADRYCGSLQPGSHELYGTLPGNGYLKGTGL